MHIVSLFSTALARDRPTEFVPSRQAGLTWFRSFWRVSANFLLLCAHTRGWSTFAKCQTAIGKIDAIAKICARALVKIANSFDQFCESHRDEEWSSSGPGSINLLRSNVSAGRSCANQELAPLITPDARFAKGKVFGAPVDRSSKAEYLEFVPLMFYRINSNSRWARSQTSCITQQLRSSPVHRTTTGVASATDKCSGGWSLHYRQPITTLSTP